MDHQPEEGENRQKAGQVSKRDWDFHKIGYETAWHLGTLQIRAPGFRVRPKKLRAVTPEQAIEVIVEFINRPRADVTVSISLTSPADGIYLSHQTMIFTPETHNEVQIVAVEADLNVPEETDVTIEFVTQSDDEVYNHLDDLWKLTFNHKEEEKEGQKAK